MACVSSARENDVSGCLLEPSLLWADVHNVFMHSPAKEHDVTSSRTLGHLFFWERADTRLDGELNDKLGGVDEGGLATGISELVLCLMVPFGCELHNLVVVLS